MYVDECGTDDIVSCHLDQHRHLALTGVIISHEAGATYANPRLAALKHKHFPQADQDAPPVVLHRSDFLKGNGPFQSCQDETNLTSLCNDLHEYLLGLEHTVITVVIDKHDETMALHLAESSLAFAPGAHAVVLMDQAGWHTTGKLDVPANISIVALPAKRPELNPVENIWQFPNLAHAAHVHAANAHEAARLPQTGAYPERLIAD